VAEEAERTAAETAATAPPDAPPLVEAAAAESAGSAAPAAAASAPARTADLPLKPMATYSWDQSDKYTRCVAAARVHLQPKAQARAEPPPCETPSLLVPVGSLSDYSCHSFSGRCSVYLSFDGVGAIQNAVNCGFSDVGFELTIDDVDAKVPTRHQLKITNLCKPIDVAGSKLTVKADRLVVKLRKRGSEDPWCVPPLVPHCTLHTGPTQSSATTARWSPRAAVVAHCAYRTARTALHVPHCTYRTAPHERLGVCTATRAVYVCGGWHRARTCTIAVGTGIEQLRNHPATPCTMHMQ
jgi:hypothetical protein